MNSLPTEFFFASFFVISVSVKFLIFFMNFFLDFVYFLCFPAACFLKKKKKKLFWIIYQLSCQIAWFWVWLLEGCYHFVITDFHDFSCPWSFALLFSHLKLWTPQIFNSCLLVGDSLHLPCLYMVLVWIHLLHTLCGRIFNLVCPLWFSPVWLL